MTQPADTAPRLWAGHSKFGWVFSVIWLVYLGYPIDTARKLEDPVARAFALIVVAAFALTFLASFFAFRHRKNSRYRWPRPDPRWVWIAIAIETVLTVLAAVPLHSDAFAFLVYIAATAAIALPTRQAWAVVVVLVAVVLVVPALIPGWESQNQLAFQLAVTAFAAWGVSQIVLRNQQLDAAREHLAVLAVAEERSRVARDVHDILGHSLTVITVKTELARALIDADVERAKAELADIERLSRDALAGVRDTVGGLREVTLTGELANARSALAAAGIQARLPDRTDAVPASRREIFGWVVREGVTNVVRHSGAQTCTIRLAPDSVEVVDDGRGIDPASASGGSGLPGLRDRVAAAQGSLVTGAVNGSGFRLRAEFPMSEALR